jgi:predicted amidohydrolase YtcJ
MSPATLVIWHAQVYTGDPAAPAAEAVVVHEGRVVYVGADAGAEPWIRDGAGVVDATGKGVVPGFVDAHLHPVEGGVELATCALGAAEDPAALVAAVLACHAAAPGAGWLIGSGWELPAFPGNGPLDVVLERPVWLGSADGHSDPPGGRIERGPDGTPTGLLRETAVEVAARVLPEPTRAQYAAGLRRALALANANGLTTLFEAHATDEVLRAYRDLERTGELTARVTAALELSPGDAVRRLVATRRRFQTDRVRPVAAKIFVDGVIEAHTAAMLAPYVDTGEPGAPLWTDSALRDAVQELVAAGFDVHFHAIGDRAVRMALDAVEAAGPSSSRFSIAHLEAIDPADVPRFATLGVAAVFQPLWAYPDAYIRDLTEPVLGPERSARLYPIAEVARTGARLAFGSDWSVSTLDPLDGIEVAVTRRDPDAGGAPLGSGQGVTVETALVAYTAGAAWVTRREDEVGRLFVGGPADLVVLSGDPLTVDPAGLGDLQVELTVFDGRVVFPGTR